MKIRLIYLFFVCLIRGVAMGQNMPDSVMPPDIKEMVATGAHTPYMEKMDQLLKTVPWDKSPHEVKRIDPNFKEKYLQDSEFDYGRKEGGNSFWTSLKKSILKLLRGLFGLSPNVSPDFFPILLKVLSGLVILVVIYFAVRIYLSHKGKWFLEKKNDTLDIDVHDVAQLIQSADFASLIAEAEKENDTRLSIRYYYLWLLKKLKDGGVIEWLPDKTNSNYLYEIKNAEVKNQFSHLSYLYEYIWYGEFSINDREYQEAKTTFGNFLRKEVRRG
ncbi:MAG: hypothetical protein BGN96_09590 [Bacteroidales bacterium 45-6]|nr:MAG: hypothetical protein BGN96_09590 [Bacteroidales bacterium 45-6]